MRNPMVMWPLTSRDLKGETRDLNTVKANISKTAGNRLRSKGPPIGNGLCGIQWSHDQWRHVTPKGQTRDPNTLWAQYLENSWTCYLVTIANSRVHGKYLPWGSTVGYPSDSLASCFLCCCKLMLYVLDHLLSYCIRFLDHENCMFRHQSHV